VIFFRLFEFTVGVTFYEFKVEDSPKGIKAFAFN